MIILQGISATAKGDVSLPDSARSLSEDTETGPLRVMHSLPLCATSPLLLPETPLPFRPCTAPFIGKVMMIQYCRFSIALPMGSTHVRLLPLRRLPCVESQKTKSIRQGKGIAEHYWPYVKSVYVLIIPNSRLISDRQTNE